jgi:hypothetical protein
MEQCDFWPSGARGVVCRSAHQEEGVGRSRLLGGCIHSGSKLLGRERACSGGYGGDREVRDNSGVMAAIGVVIRIFIILAIRTRAMDWLRCHAWECWHAGRGLSWKCGHCG